MLLSAPEEMRKDKAHYKKGEQGREHAPDHAEIGAIIFLFEISLNKLREQKSVLKKPRSYSLEHQCVSR